MSGTDPVTFEQMPKLLAEMNRRLERIEDLLLDRSMPQKAEPDLMSINEASSFLNLTVATLYSMVSRKQIPHSKRGKKLYFSRIELSEYVRDGRVLTNAEVKKNAVRNAAKAMKCGAVQ